MRRSFLYAFFWLIGMLLLCESAITGEVEGFDATGRSTPNAWSFKPNCTIRWKGLIDGKLVRAIVEVNSANDDGLFGGGLAGDDYLTLCLDSAGGEIDYVPEVLLAMGAHWVTVIEAGKECHSSCAWIFMGGGSRSSQNGIFDGFVDKNPGRFLNINGKLSFHGPEWLDGQATAQEAYSQQLKTIESLLFFSSLLLQKEKLRPFQDKLEPHLRRYLENSNGVSLNTPRDALDDSVIRPSTELMPPALFFKFLTVPNSGKYEIVDVGQALAWGIDLFGLERPFTLDENFVFQACANRIWFHCVQHDTCWTEEGIGLVPTVDASGNFLLSFLREGYSAKLKTLSMRSDEVSNEPPWQPAADQVPRRERKSRHYRARSTKKQGPKKCVIGELVLKPSDDEHPVYDPICVVRIEKDGDAITAFHVATPFEFVKPPAVQPPRFFEAYLASNPIEDKVGQWPNRNVATWIGLPRSTRLKDLAPPKQ